MTRRPAPAALRALPLVAAGALLAAARPAGAQTDTVARFPAYPGDSTGAAPGAPYEVRVQADGGRPGARRFDLTTTAPQRPGDPQARTLRERAGRPFVASGSLLFDALFAQAVDDAREAGVDEIRDGAYNAGRPIPCACFVAGEKWPYVWTRDLAYALDLGLAALDPRRAVTSLLFKTSGFRPGVPVPAGLPDGAEQIIQDTGSGGSWPVSTDRVVWAVGAERTLAELTGAARRDFARRAYRALRGTLEADRVAAYDARDGLYGGEHGFMDWREQTYPGWVVDDLTAIAQSKALSTNAVELRALRLAARLAGEFGDATLARRYAGWADALVSAIDRRFWVSAAGLYATYTTADRAAGAAERYDLLGNMLAIEAGVAGPARAHTILSRYPFAPFGPPVIWPEAPGVPVNHNRAQWPFVTAYALRAAAGAGHAAAADRALAALVRGAALHLSNMENLEWLTGRSRFDDGPVIDSRRQLWSVGGYVGAVTGTVFGWRVGPNGARVAPFLTARTRALLGPADSARLGGLAHQGRPVEVVLRLPAAAAEGSVYPVREVRLNGRVVPDGTVAAARLRPSGNRVEVRFGAPRAARDSIAEVRDVPARSHDDPRVFMPRTPGVTAARDSVAAGGAATVAVAIADSAQAGPVTYRVYRDGRRVADGVSARTWRDPAPPAAAATACYTAVAVFTGTRLASQPSAPACVRGALAQTIAATDPRVSGAPLVPAGDGVDRPTRRLGLGARLVVADVRIAQGGDYAVAADYDNHVFALNTGVTNAVKRLTITDAAGRRREAVLQLPHVRPLGEGAGAAHPVRRSTRAYVRLAPGTYRLELTDYFNMSALAANATYTGPGGAAGPVNEARVAAITLDALEEAPPAFGP